MKLSDMLDSVTRLHETAKSIVWSAREAWIVVDASAEDLQVYADQIGQLYEMAFAFAKRHGTKSVKVWNLIREIHTCRADVGAYMTEARHVAELRAARAARAAAEAEFDAVASEVAEVVAEVAEIKAKVDEIGAEVAEIGAEVAEITGEVAEESAPEFLPEPPAEIILPEGCRLPEPTAEYWHPALSERDKRVAGPLPMPWIEAAPLQIWGSGARNHKTGIAS